MTALVLVWSSETSVKPTSLNVRSHSFFRYVIGLAVRTTQLYFSQLIKASLLRRQCYRVLSPSFL